MNNIKENIVCNYSSVTLTDNMLRLLNTGFNFSILPYKLDTTQVEQDLKGLKGLQCGKSFGMGGIN